MICAFKHIFSLFIFFVATKKTNQKKMLAEKNDLRLTASTFFCDRVFASLIFDNASPYRRSCTSIRLRSKYVPRTCYASDRIWVLMRNAFSGQ
jgi:hypothetical protein